MSTNLAAYAELKANVEALTAEVSRLKAAQPNLAHFASEIGKHLVKFETDVTSNFTDKFAGRLFGAIDAWTSRLEQVEETQAKLEKVLNEYATTYDSMLTTHRTAISRMLKTHESSIQTSLNDNEQKFSEPQKKISELAQLLKSYNSAAVDLYNSSLLLVSENEKTLTKVDAVVDKFNEVSTGTLEQIAETAQESIKQTTAAAQRQVEKVVEDTQRHVEGTRKRYLKVLGSLDNRILEHPMIFIMSMSFVLAAVVGVMGVYAGKWSVERHAQQMVDEAIASAMQTVEAKVQQISEQTKSLDMTFQDAQMWDALTDHMSYEQKMAYIKQAQQQAQQQGRKLNLPKAMQEQARK